MSKVGLLYSVTLDFAFCESRLPPPPPKKECSPKRGPFKIIFANCLKACKLGRDAVF